MRNRIEVEDEPWTMMAYVPLPCETQIPDMACPFNCTSLPKPLHICSALSFDFDFSFYPLHDRSLPPEPKKYNQKVGIDVDDLNITRERRANQKSRT